MELLKIAREDSLAVWDEHFKTILLLLLETLGDKDVRYLRGLLNIMQYNCVNVFVGGLLIPAELNSLCFPSAHHPSPGPACAERNSEEPAGPLQELC